MVRGTVTARRAPNLVEGREPGCVAVGLVFLTNPPKARGAKPGIHSGVSDVKEQVEIFCLD
jgi:hypothetical protein